MIYPKFIKEKETIGVCAPSAGIGRKIDLYEESIALLNKTFKIKETESVRVNNMRSTTAKKRAQELSELVKDKNVKMIMTATGGDYMFEILPYVKWEEFKENPKWIMGASDPTNILYPITCRYDIATLYGFNAGSYYGGKDITKDNNLNIIKGNIIKQKSFKKYRSFLDTISGELELKQDVKWLAKKDMTISGRLIGGCFEVIAAQLGTPYDYTNDFCERHKEDGIVFYFDIFSMSAYDVYLKLLQFKYAGYFKYCKGVLFGRVAFPNEDSMKYEEAYKLALKDIPYISEMDIGHVYPFMTIINGSLVKATYKNHKGSIEMKLK